MTTRIRSAFLAPILMLGLGACAAEPPPAAPTPAPDTVAAAPVDTAPPDLRAAVQPLPVPNAFEAAIAADTRTETGEPGADYWQQKVDYVIAAELDPESAILRGNEVITYHNRSPDALSSMVLHLYQNLFSQGVMRNRNVPITGGMTIERVVVNDREAQEVDRPGAGAGPTYVIDGTLMALNFPQPVSSGGSMEVEIDWSFPVPPAGAPRMGRIGNQLFNIAQWYPQVATYDDLVGWHMHPYLGDGEFYLEYGDFEVSVTVPEGWLVGATGTLRNPGEVLSERVRERLAAVMASDDVVHVVTEGDFGPGNATEQAPGGQLTWRFTAEGVRDFAFATSDRYLWDAVRAEIPTTSDADGDMLGEPDPEPADTAGAADQASSYIPVHAFYRPEASDWREAAEFTRHAIEYHSRNWLPYIYPQITSAEGPVGGMEYPMLSFVRDFGNPEQTYRVIDHEVAHQWNAMMVGPNEERFPWQDEGLNSYIENRSAAEFLGVSEAEAFEGDLNRYLSIAGTDIEVPIMRPADLFGIGPQRVVASYSKPGVVLRALEAAVGDDAVRRGMRAYHERWLLAHPHALDFFNTMEDAAGEDLDWFWHPWFYTTETLDQAVTSVVRTDVGAEITVSDLGGVPMPVDLAVTTASGETVRAEVPVSVWLEGAREHTVSVTVDGSVTRVEADPEMLLPDVDRDNNVWEGEGPDG